MNDDQFPSLRHLLYCRKKGVCCLEAHATVRNALIHSLHLAKQVDALLADLQFMGIESDLDAHVAPKNNEDN